MTEEHGMVTKRIYLYPDVSDDAYMDAYFLAPTRPNQTRGVVVVVQGGAYWKTTFRETEPVALAFAAAGYHAVTLKYRFLPHRYPAPLADLAVCVKTLRENAAAWGIDPDRIILCGFSAGAHLCGALGVHWHTRELAALVGASNERIRPDRMILGYPVITAGQYTHQPSMDNLCGDDADARARMSLEHWVSVQTPPTFLWHTVADEHVPVQNSLLFAQALAEHGVSFEMHIYPEGRHGMCLANRLSSEGDPTRENKTCAGWLTLALDWLGRAYETGEET